MSDSDLFARLESADGDSPSNSQEGDESGSIPDSGISLNEKPQLYEKLYVEDVGQDTKGGKRQVYDKNGCIIGMFFMTIFKKKGYININSLIKSCLTV